MNTNPLLVKLNIVGREKSRGAVVVSEPPVLVREFLLYVSLNNENE
jgi:hypothetical protein